MGAGRLERHLVARALARRMLVLEDVAKLISVSPKQLRNMVDRGQFPRGKRVPGLGLRWAPAVVDAWIAAALETA